MPRHLGLALATCLMVAADPEGDQEKIQGAWVLVARQTNGQADDPEALKQTGTTMVFDEDRVIVKMGEMSTVLGTFALDSTKAPRHYNRTYPDGTPRLGIYELEDDALKICIAGLGKDRPTSFVTKPGDGAALLVYKRKKP